MRLNGLSKYVSLFLGVCRLTPSAGLESGFITDSATAFMAAFINLCAHALTSG